VPGCRLGSNSTSLPHQQRRHPEFPAPRHMQTSLQNARLNMRILSRTPNTVSRSQISNFLKLLIGERHVRHRQRWILANGGVWRLGKPNALGKQPRCCMIAHETVDRGIWISEASDIKGFRHLQPTPCTFLEIIYLMPSCIDEASGEIGVFETLQSRLSID